MNPISFDMSVQSSSAPRHIHGGRQLNEAQKTQVTEILKAYDIDQLSSDDVLAIREAFKSANIAPGRDLRAAVEAAGFQMTQLALPEGVSGGAHKAVANAQALGGRINVEV